MNKTYSTHNKKQIIIITFNNKHVAVVLIAEGHIAADTYRTYQIRLSEYRPHTRYSLYFTVGQKIPRK